MTFSLEIVASNQAFGGQLTKYRFKESAPAFDSNVNITVNALNTQSAALGGLFANFNLFLPANTTDRKVPVLIYLAGLTCTEDTG
jgi:S-formylglutathione hydrolase